MSLRLRLTVVAAALALSGCKGGTATAAPSAPAKPTTTATAAKPGTAAVKPPTSNWLDVIVATPQGGFRQGNPNAKVKLLEFGSLTCSHCAAFAKEGVPTLRSQYVATGKVSYEWRPFILNGVDFAPSLLVRCQPPAAAIRLIDVFYDQQPQWILPFTKPLPDDVQKKLSAMPQEQQITAFAAQGGLDAFMRTRGMTRARFDQCTSDKAGIAKLGEIRDDADKNYGLTGTPTFAINGKTLPDTANWARLKPQLDAAL